MFTGGVGNYRKYTDADALFDKAVTTDDSPLPKFLLCKNKNPFKGRTFNITRPSSNGKENFQHGPEKSTCSDSTNILGPVNGNEATEDSFATNTPPYKKSHMDRYSKDDATRQIENCGNPCIFENSFYSCGSERLDVSSFCSVKVSCNLVCLIMSQTVIFIDVIRDLCRGENGVSKFYEHVKLSLGIVMRFLEACLVGVLKKLTFFGRIRCSSHFESAHCSEKK